MTTFGYIRVSGKGQIDGDGPQRQEDVIRRFCRATGLMEPQFFFEKGVSGTVEGMERPEFARMVDSIEKYRTLLPGAEVCIIVERMDRWARTLVVSELLMVECEQRKIPVYAADQGTLVNQADAGEDPSRKMIRQIFGVLAEWNKSVTVRRLRVARDRIRAKNGRCEGPKPYGASPHELMVLREAKALWNSDKYSLSQIAKMLNLQGYNTRKGRPWTRGSVYQIITERAKKRRLIFS